MTLFQRRRLILSYLLDSMITKKYLGTLFLVCLISFLIAYFIDQYYIVNSDYFRFPFYRQFMIFRLDRFFFDEKDVFVFFLGVFLVVSFFFQIPLGPFRPSSLLVVFLFLCFTRSLVSQLKFNSYFFIILSGLLLSTFLSPYGLIIYLLIALLLYSKMRSL